MSPGMPSTVLSSRVRSLKWAAQCHPDTVKSGRVQKSKKTSSSSSGSRSPARPAPKIRRSSSSSTTSTVSTSSSDSSSSTDTVTPEKPANPYAQVHRLESELAFAYDSLATISVMFDGLRHAYYNSRSKIEQYKNDTRLGDMEKELLTAYDDLDLQVVHLEREIMKLESQLAVLKSEHNTIEVCDFKTTPPVLDGNLPFLFHELPSLSDTYLDTNPDLHFYLPPYPSEMQWDFNNHSFF
ncbi:uncharacterized protein BYT42DRAFT_561914 [Radiomyces spectabilis]|uniref:uncharacterized protein n=1 Tax=Radiomyces spectabilis TaxID=64574 RepID=UPI00221EC7A3|nr:uncharacterized protein BYT42DRAFT_561914 [Radiomyces spectabilis]KAI8384261.1 hypothetical protein BYT42DRAFT_561914 [Radiomyces spectabilis]